MPDTDAIATVRAFLGHLEARDLEAAKALVTEDFEMVFPGGHVFTRFEDLIDWAAPRYRWVGKRYERFDVAPGDDGVVVTCFGTLHGEWPDGTPFDGIRFCDWFLLRDSGIARQKVWNDMGEIRGQSKG